MNATQQTPAGLLSDGTEIFFNKENLYATHKGKVIPFQEWPKDIVLPLLAELEADDEANKLLQEKSLERWTDQLFVYAKCCFGGFSLAADIAPNGTTNTEHWNCGCNGNCCLKPLFKQTIPVKNGYLTPREIEVVRNLAQGNKGAYIAHTLGISEVTLDKHKKSIFNKTGLQTTLELTKWAMAENIL